MHSRRLSVVANRVLFVLLASTLMHAHLFLRRQKLNLRLQEFAEILLEVAEPARTKPLEKMRQLKRAVYRLAKNPRPP